jgi:catechol 2,3-dioxygenase-like lactoylglutathione lyase family enzyme
MIPSRGLTHIALRVRDVERAFRFYESVFGVIKVFEADDFIQAQTPSSWDVLVFETSTAKRGMRSERIAHFGFRLLDPRDIDAAVATIESAGGKILSRGEFVPGEPYVFFHDLDGNEVEVWYESPTAVDPTE